MLIRDSVLYILARLVPGAIMVASNTVLTYLLSPANYGIYGFALVIMNLGATIGFDWLGPTFLRLYESRRQDRATVGTFIWIFVVLVAASAAVAAVIEATGIVGPNERVIFYIGIGLVWVSSWFEMISRIEIADFRPLSYFFLYFGRAALMAGGAILGVWLTASPIWAAVGTFAGLLASSVLGSISRHDISLRYFDKAFAGEIVRFGAPLWLTMIFGGLMIVGTRGLVGLLGSAEALGIFTVAFTLVQNALSNVGTGIFSATLPAAVRATESGDDGSLREHLLASAQLILAIMLPASLGMALTAHGMAALFVGPEFVPGVAPLIPWLAFAALFQTFRSCYLDLGFQLARRPIGLVWVMATACGVAAGLSFLLIPRFGAVGGAIALTTALAISSVHCWLLCLKTFPMPLPFVQGGQILFCCGGLALAVLAISGDDHLAFALRVAAGAATYAALAVLINLAGARVRLAHFIRSARQRRVPTTEQRDAR